MYGLTRPGQVVWLATDVCDVLGYGSTGTALELLIETAAQETWIGTVPDKTPYGAGTGLCQFDHIGFVDVVKRCRSRWKRKIKDAFNVDIDKVSYVELEHSPFLSLLFCRLKYLLVREAIPSTVEGRAHYWKKYYNSRLGKGKPEEYVRNAARFVQPLLKEKNDEG